MSTNGLWLLVDGRELFLGYRTFPWFRDATIGQIAKVRRMSRTHLHWPDLDVDLELDSIERPASYPLVSKQRPVVREKAPSPKRPGAGAKKRRTPKRRAP